MQQHSRNTSAGQQPVSRRDVDDRPRIAPLLYETSSVMEKVEACIKRSPGKSLAIAVVAGILIGWWVKRS